MNPLDLILLIIDIPDERTGARNSFQHMHAWGTREEMTMLQRILEETFGNQRRHEIWNDRFCPHCGAVPDMGVLRRRLHANIPGSDASEGL